MNENSQIVPGQGKSLLLISPAEEIRKQILEHLDTRYLTVAQRSEILEGIEVAQLDKPDVIIIDEACKAMPAREAGRVLKAKLPYVPLILLSDDQSSDNSKHCLEFGGFDLILSKEMNFDSLEAQLKAMLRSSMQIRQLMETNRRLNRMSVQDPLTGLYNHKHLLDWLHIEFKRAERNAEPLSCIMLDIDHFKMINDSYGHKFGDYVLKTFAYLIQYNIRKIDISGRYGGEEFLIILPNTDLHGAINVAEKLRRIIERHSFKEGVFEVNLQASFGVASTSEDRSLQADHLLQMADKALYLAKESGRNRVCSSAEIARSADDPETPVSSRTLDPKRRLVHILCENDSPVRKQEKKLAAEGFQVLQTANFDGYRDNLVAFPSDLLIVDLSLPFDIQLKAQDALPDYIKQNHATVLWYGTPANKGEAGIPGIASDASRYVNDDDLVTTIQTVLRIKNLEADLRESNSRLKIVQRKLIRSERMKALGEVSSGVAHDLNNYLGIILGRSQFLQDKTHDSSIRRGLEIIEKKAKDGAHMLKRILEFFRPEYPVNLEPLSIRDLLDNCLEFTKVRWRDEANLRGVRFDIDLDIPEDAYVMGSEPELSEVVTNLIFNALDAMPEGGHLSLTCEAKVEEHDIHIRDTGTGMAPDIVEKVFDPFFTTKNEKGTGLGLNVAQGIITRHNGQIQVDSKEGIGTDFIIKLPAYKGTLPNVPEIQKEETAVASTHLLKIMLVDDEEEILQVFDDILSEAGYSITLVDHGAKALELIKQSHFDVVMTDLGMPEVSGWDVARGVKDASPSTVVILTSGWGDNYEKEILDEKGIDHVLPKPVGVENLLQTMSKINSKIESQQIKKA